MPYGTPVGFDGRHSVAGTETDYYVNPVSHECEDETTSDDPITSYGWDFGDGTTASGSTANHTYTRAGDFTATLTVRTAHRSDSTSTVISVKGVVPSLAVSQTTEWRKSFDASGSQGAYALADYAWEFGDGAVEHGATATHTYAAAGQYTVKLTVTDVNGMSASATEALDIAADHTAPGIAVRTPGPDAVYLVGQPVTADYSCSDDGGSGFPRGADGGLLANGCLGPLAPGETIDTTTPGDRSFTVATEDVAGNKGTAAVSYHVVSKAPTVSITSPADGASYARGAIVASNYTCVILWVSATCTGSAPDGSNVANGEPFDTSTLGHHTFTAAGRTAQGTATTKTVGYEVVDATAPTAVVQVPAESSVVRRGEIVRASFTCA